MKIIGLTRIRNESLIIEETLDRWSELCDTIIVYDDCSTDNTVALCEAHFNVSKVIEGAAWDLNRGRAEYQNRQELLEAGQEVATKKDWFVYFDADEHPYDFTNMQLFKDSKINCIKMRLYDVHITPEDVDKNYLDRRWVCPDFRIITFFFKNVPGIKYYFEDQRPVYIPNQVSVLHGTIKHYGKGYSVEQWEDTCEYYYKHFPKYSIKWRDRKGHAIKTDMLSDFGKPLMLWEDREK